MADERCRPTDKGTGDHAARVALIERSILVLLVLSLFIGVMAVVRPFTTAILFGAALATAAWPIRQALVRQGLGRGSTAALLLLLSLVLVILPLLAFAPHLAAVVFCSDAGTARLAQNRTAPRPASGSSLEPRS